MVDCEAKASGLLQVNTHVVPPAPVHVATESYQHLALVGVLFVVGLVFILSFCIGQAWSSFRRKETAKAETSHGITEILLQWFNILVLLMVPGIMAAHYNWGATTVFVLNALAVLPLANMMGEATEELACHTGEALGGLLQATFGNAVELIVVVQSLRRGLLAVTKGSLVGSILANELLVLGASLFYGGLFEKHGPWQIAVGKTQKFNKASAMVQAQLLFLAAFVVCIPSIFEQSTKVSDDDFLHISRAGSVCILMGYISYLTFQLYTHRTLGNTVATDAEEPRISAFEAVFVLLLATVLVAVASEYITGAIEGFAKQMQLSETFVGVVLIPILGGACENAAAVKVAIKDKLDLSISIALGSAIQIALFVMPFAVVVGWLLGQPMDWSFSTVNAWALMFSALLVLCVTVTGESYWFNGLVLLIAYVILALLYFFAPNDSFMLHA